MITKKVGPNDKLEVYRKGRWWKVPNEDFWLEWGRRRVNGQRYYGLSLKRPDKPFIEESKRKLIFGYTVAKVLIWMGLHEFTIPQAQKVLQRFGLIVEKNKIAKQLEKGRTGDIRPIKLLKHERNKLKIFAGIIKVRKGRRRC